VSGNNDDRFYDLVGQVGCHEAVMIAALVFDLFPKEVFTTTGLAHRIRDLVTGFDVWTPLPQLLKHYCRLNISKGGVVEPVRTDPGGAVLHGYQASAGSADRLRLYRNLATWGLHHPDVSVQQLLGPPRGGGRTTPAHLRLPMYATLLANHPQFTTYGDLIAATLSDQVPLHSFRQTIAVLTTHKILVKRTHPANPRMGAVAIAEPRLAAIRDLLDSITGARNASGSSDPAPPGAGHRPHPFNHPDTIAELLAKFTIYSSKVVGTRRGSSASAQEIHDLVAQAAPTPLSANQICQQLIANGRMIGRFRVLVYLKELVEAGKLIAIKGACPPEGLIWSANNPSGYTTAPPAEHHDDCRQPQRAAVAAPWVARSAQLDNPDARRCPDDQ
jgi:hypothetical protein